MGKKVQTNLRLDEQIKREAMKRAIDEDVSLATVVERLLEDWLYDKDRRADCAPTNAHG